MLPTRPADRLPYGDASRLVLQALATPRTVAQVAEVLGWDHDRARSWVHRLRGTGQVARVQTTRCARGQEAGVYQIIME